MSAAGVRGQGGRRVTALVRWDRAPAAGPAAEPFEAPAVFPVADQNRNIDSSRSRRVGA